MPKELVVETNVNEHSDSLPDTLRPYVFHGVDLNWKSGDKEAIGDCPWCGREGKFSVNVAKGTYRCFVCAEGTSKGGGNAYTLIRRIHDASLKQKLSSKTFDVLKTDRRLLDVQSLKNWGIVPSISTRNWLVPGYGIDGKLNQLYRYISVQGKMRLIPTPTLGHQIHASTQFNSSKPTIYVCEGPWDAIALEEVLQHAKMTSDGIKLTSNPHASMAAESLVIAVPGCETFNESWLPLFSNKQVVLLYDSDHPKKNAKTGKTTEPAGWHALKRVTGLLSASAEPPSEIMYLNWGENGYDPDLPSGHDLRDQLGAGETAEDRVKLLAGLFARIVPVHESWIQESKKASTRKAGKKNGLSLQDCSSYAELIQTWRKAMKWTSGLDHALAVMLSAIVSTKQVGDQLWFKIIGPPSCGKSTLCEAISTATDYVYAKSTMRGFHSGMDDGSGEDYSPLVQMSGKTLVTKDGDTLLQAPNLPQILAEARDLYDTVSRSSYRTKQGGRDYTGIRMTWLLCGTSGLRQLDESELGARFLDCVIMEGIDADLENDILLRTVYKARRNILIEADGNPETQQEPTMTDAMQRTGGYVCYLRENATSLLSQVDVDDKYLHKIVRYAQFVAYFRARPSKRQQETAEREMASRLVSQHTRLALCLAVVLNKKQVDKEVMGRVQRIALDTARGSTLKIGALLYKHQEEGCDVRQLHLACGLTEDETRKLLRYLRSIGVADLYTPSVRKGKGVVSSKPRWKMTEELVKLYTAVHEEL